MSERILVAEFEHESDLLNAAAEIRRLGLRIVDCFTPYAVHGLDRAMGLRPSRLTWVCFLCGMTGALAMLWFEHWTASVWWPINVGGKPWNSLASDVPVAFEAAVLLAGFGSVLALLAVSRLYPGKATYPVADGITDDRFVMMIAQSDAAFDLAAVQKTLLQFHVLRTEEQILNGKPSR